MRARDMRPRAPHCAVCTPYVRYLVYTIHFPARTNLHVVSTSLSLPQSHIRPLTLTFGAGGERGARRAHAAPRAYRGRKKLKMTTTATPITARTEKAMVSIDIALERPSAPSSCSEYSRAGSAMANATSSATMAGTGFQRLLMGV